MKNITERKGLLSKHIITPKSPVPAYGLILIEGSTIKEIIFLDDEIPLDMILDKYYEWNIEELLDYYISPGLIDISVRREFEDYSQLTQAAISGGVTFLLEEEGYYSDEPPSGELYCDIGGVRTIALNDIGDLKSVKATGCFAMKGYMYPPSITVNCLPSNLSEVFAEVRSLNLPLFLDPNFPSNLGKVSPLRLEALQCRLNKHFSFPDAMEFVPIYATNSEAPSPGNSALNVYKLHLEHYDPLWEMFGVERLLSGFTKHQCNVHICNISSAKTFKRVLKIKRQYKIVTCEVPAAHLYFNSEDIADGDTRFKNQCAVRNASNYDLLWEIILSKGIDCVVSQHASIDRAYKKNGSFRVAANGINSLGFTLQCVWTMMNKPKISHRKLEEAIVKISKWTSLKPAQIIGCSEHRGVISKNKFADLVIWKPYERCEVQNVFSGNPEMNPFVGMSLMGNIHKVYLRGNLVFSNGNFLSSTGMKILKID